MKNSVKWMMVIVVALVCSGAQAVFDPNTDSSLVFNLNFQTNPSSTTTTDAKAGLTGTLEDYNTAGFDVFQENGIRYTSGDFNAVNDANSNGGGDTNDCAFTFIPTGSDAFEFGSTSDDSTGNRGYIGYDEKTFAFWFNLPSVSSGGTFFRQESWDIDGDSPDYYWEIRAIGGKLSFHHGTNALRFETSETLVDLGVTDKTWHHAVVVFDRSNARITSSPTTALSCKMYIDGAEVPILVTYYNTESVQMDTYGDWCSPLYVGRGARAFDGLLDEVRFYNRALTALEVSLIYQNNPAVAHAKALLPVPKSSNVRVDTDVNWVPATGATAQYVYFGTDSNMANLTQVASGNGTLAKVAHSTLSSTTFPLSTTYYWYVKSTLSGSDVNSTLWSFTTETGKATDPDPADEEEDVDVSDVNLAWTASATASSFDVYYSTNKSLVEANDSSVLIADNITDVNVEDVDTTLRGQTYYWKVVSNYSTGSVAGDVWSFTSRPYEIIFNTSTATTSYQGNTAIPALCVVVHGNGWYTLRADGNSTSKPTESDVIGKVGTDGVVIYDFNVFSFDKRFAITVVPVYTARDCYNSSGAIMPRPIAIHVNNGGNFYFDGRIDISGEDILVTGARYSARSGGFASPLSNSGTTTSATNVPDYISWSDVSIAAPYYNRFGSTTGAKVVYLPDSNAYKYFGPGMGAIPPYKGGGGSSYGGLGGICGRGYFYGMRTFGPTYGDKEVPVPFGGSAGGWGGTGAGTAGGGGIEIVAAGYITLDTNSAIYANAGNSLYTACDYPGGGGSGGSVKIIAGGNVATKGIINVSGGSGGNTNKQANECGGGGAGGRVAIFYGGTYTNGGTINVQGGEKGIYPNGGASLADDGEDGTIYIVNSATVSPKKASAPAPQDGERSYIGTTDPNTTFKLKWYSGYGATNDKVWFGTSVASLAPTGATITATRGQHSVTVSVGKDKTYYWQVKSDANTIATDVWSFSTVNWDCPVANASTSSSLKYAAGPTWDFNYDCVVTNEDFWEIAKDWRVERVSGSQDYTLEDMQLYYLMREWMECQNRTDGCDSWK